MQQTNSAGDFQTTACYICGAVMHRATKLERIEYEGMVSDEYEASMWRCGTCGEEFCTGSDMRVTERQMNILKTRAQQNMDIAGA